MADLNGASYNDLAPAAGVLDPSRFSFYALGNWAGGHNNDFSNKSGAGNTGLLMKVAPDLVMGVGFIAAQTNLDTDLGGSSHTSSTGATMLMAYEPESGLRLYGTASVAGLDVETHRFYLNAGLPESSRGETDGTGYGFALRGGYEFPVSADVTLMPYAEAQYSKASLGAYTEVGGAFPAVVEHQDAKSFTSVLGAEASWIANDKLTLRGRAGWGHRYTDDNSVVATAISLTTTVTDDPGAPNWVETGVGATYAYSDQVSFSGDVSGRFGNTSDPALNMTAGVKIGF